MLQVRSSLALLCQERKAGRARGGPVLGFQAAEPHLEGSRSPPAPPWLCRNISDHSDVYFFERILKICSAQLPVLRTLQIDRLRATSRSQNFKKQGLGFLTALPCFYFFFSKFLLHSFSQHSPVTHQPEPRISPSASRDKGRTCPEAADTRTTHPWRSHRPPEQVIPLTCRLQNLEKGFTQLLITLVLEYRRYSVSHYQGGEKKKKHRSQYCSQFQTGSFSASEELFRREKQNHPKSHEGSCLLLQPSFFFFFFNQAPKTSACRHSPPLPDGTATPQVLPTPAARSFSSRGNS